RRAYDRLKAFWSGCHRALGILLPPLPGAGKLGTTSASPSITLAFAAASRCASISLMISIERSICSSVIAWKRCRQRPSLASCAERRHHPGNARRLPSRRPQGDREGDAEPAGGISETACLAGAARAQGRA